MSNFSEEPRLSEGQQQLTEQSRMANQPVAVRFFDSKNPEDMKRLLAMVSMEAVKKWMGEVDGMEMKDVVKWAKQKGKKVGRGYQEECLFAISGSTEETHFPNEVGEVQGFINSYELDSELLDRMIKKDYLHSNDLPVIEISFAKNPSLAPNRVANGLIQACFQLNKMFSGLEDLGQTEPSLQIVAFADPNNHNSNRCLSQAFFDHLGEIKYDNESTTLDNVYLFDWQKAQAFLHQEADKIKSRMVAKV